MSQKNKYKVEFVQTEKFIIDVFAETEDEAKKIAEEKWDEGDYQETGDLNVEIDTVYDVTNTEDPFNPVNEKEHEI